LAGEAHGGEVGRGGGNVKSENGAIGPMAQLRSCFQGEGLVWWGHGKDAMSEGESIVCRPTKWFLWRAVAMFAMFAFFAGWFFRDWRSGYARKNRIYYSYAVFDMARDTFGRMEEEGLTAEKWRSFVEERTMGEAVRKVAEGRGRRSGDGQEGGEVEIPPGIDPEAPWPEVLADYETYRAAYEADRGKAAPPLWVEYSDERRWDSKKPKTAYSKEKVRNQLIYASVSGALALGVAFFTLRVMRRSMRVDEEAFYAPNGKRIPFPAIWRIDKRKWETKGLATLYYDEGGVQKKAKVDGMVYGQFKPENEAPAERLFQRILSRFSGELVELEGEAEGEGEEEAVPDGGRGL